MKWIVEMDEDAVVTTCFAIEADTEDEAIEKARSGEIESFKTETYFNDSHARFDSTHEAAEEEMHLFEN